MSVRYCGSKVAYYSPGQLLECLNTLERQELMPGALIDGPMEHGDVFMLASPSFVSVNIIIS